MPKSLLNLLEDIYSDADKWKYYKGKRGCYKSYDFLSENFSNYFIQQYFSTGKKSILTESLWRLSRLRQMHTVSTFFIGLYLYQFLNVSDYRKYKPSFRYLWFLSCLYHDFGYIIEDNIDPQWTNDIQYDIYGNLTIPKELQSYYDIATIKRYSIYRCNKDHGIEGGRKLYDLLKKNYNAYQKEWALKHGCTPIDEFCIREHNTGIWFRKSHEKYYAEVALNIMLHNIWLGNDRDTIDQYEHNGLNKLNNKKLTFSYSSALLFILIFADTLEPIKKLKDYDYTNSNEKHDAEKLNCKNYKTILNNIFIDHEEDKLVITFNPTALSALEYPYEKWVNSICGMTTWININITYENNKIEIDFNIHK